MAANFTPSSQLCQNTEKLCANLANMKQQTTKSATFQPLTLTHTRLTFTSTFLGDRSSLWLLLPIGDNEYGDDSAATGLAEFNRY